MTILQLKRKSSGATDLGLVRKNNEDVFAELPKEGFYILADGMGGHNKGEVAASEAVYYITERIKTLLAMEERLWELEDLKRHLSLLIENANAWVHHLSTAQVSCKGMGTTICSALFYEQYLIHAHIGDSRIYRLRDGDLSQMTTDHARDKHIVREYALEVVKVQKRRVLTRALGTQRIVEPDLGCDLVQPGDLYLLCSDGLTDLVTDNAIRRILQKELSIQEKNDALIDMAKAAGGNDNITLILIACHH